jgi:pimeloyl-ACP methyl ester carboxylesterase
LARKTVVASGTHQPKVRRRRMTLGRFFAWSLLVVAVLAAAFYAIGGWHFSNVLRTDLLEVSHEPPSYEIAVVDVDGSQVTLRGDDPALDHPGVLGLAWENGYAQVGEVIDASEEDGETTATRQYLPGETPLQDGTAVRLDSYAYAGDPMTAFGFPFTEVAYDSPVGEMGAWYLEGSTDTWMIIVHGRGGDRQEGLRLLPFARGRGYHILVIDHRNDEGRGEDPSGFHQYGRTEWEDVAAAARYAREHGAEDLIPVGYSAGGGAVVNFLARSPLRNQVSAAILDSPVLDLGAVVDHNASQTGLGIGPWTVPPSLTAVAKWISSWRYDLDWAEFDYIEQLWRDLHAPMLILHGTADGSVPVATSIDMQRQRPDIVTLVTFEGVDHVLGWNADREAYEGAVAAFLDANTAP